MLEKICYVRNAGAVGVDGCEGVGWGAAGDVGWVADVGTCGGIDNGAGA